MTKHKEHKCRFAVVFVVKCILEELDVTEYVADLITFGSDFFSFFLKFNFN